MQKKEFSIEVGGKTLTAMFSDLAEKAHGSVVLSYGNTAVLATVVMSQHKREGIDFFPLIVDYEERFYAAGEILGSRFMRREGRPSDEAVLGGRVVDRTIRPLFEHSLRNEVQVIITILAIDEDDPDVLAVNAASLALGTSDIPWNGPVSAVRIGKTIESDEFFVNPTYKNREQERLLFDAFICGKKDTINMIEVGAKEMSESIISDALVRATGEIEKIQKFQEKIIKEIGKEKRKIEKKEPSKELLAFFKEMVVPEIENTVFSPKEKTHIDLKDEWVSQVKETFPEEVSVAAEYFEHIVDEMLHKAALESEKRADGRAMDEVRPLFAKAGGISPVLHGVGMFYRGGTHVLSVLTLGGPKDAQLIDSMEVQEGKKYFMHHYNFPPFSGGETGRVGGMNRRMIGHGALAEKALIPILPSKDEFPYTIRIVSESLASNGSTSMGSVCASTIALMDAGVPIKRPVAGIAMGLMMKGEKYKVLTDIQGPEDHHGDMDFKVAGTSEGITAVQMDVKVEGVPIGILKEAFEYAKKARLTILQTIVQEISEPRKDVALSAPKIIKKTIKEDQIGLVIGPSGKTIKGIVKETGAEVDIEDDGTVFILGKNGAAKKAEAMIEDIVHEYKPGERFDGVVTRLMDFGAFVKIGPQAEGLVHISEFAPERINKITDVVDEGDSVPVVVKEVDERGRLNLSVKGADANFFKQKLSSLPPHDTHTSRENNYPRRGFRK